MFADGLLDSHWGNRSRRGWTTLVSFGLQAVAVAVVTSLPLLYTEGLPKLQLVAMGAPIGPPPGQRAPVTRRPLTSHPMNVPRSNIFSAPAAIPSSITPDPGPAPAEEAFACPTCVPGATGNSQVHNWVLDSIGSSATVTPPPPRPVARPPRISRMMEGNLIYRVQPVYPPLARSARVQGAVVLRAIISKSGGIGNLQVVSGHPMLVKTALDAVSQWRYRPYILNDEPVEVETQITVNFVLAGG